jgi:predicted dithiol-disulfide oxidoreductase (DUF899 family)
MALPEVVSVQEWQVARDCLMTGDSRPGRARSRRRRLPMVKFGTDYVFETPDGQATLIDLFEGWRQRLR